MAIWLKNVVVADPRSALNGTKTDIFIDQGKIVSFQRPEALPEDTVEWEGEGCIAAPGFTDIFSHFCDPGLEQKETLESGAEAAAAGGFVRAFALPNNKPVTDSKSQVEYIINKSEKLPVEIIPMGAVTQGCEGNELAEMYDMWQSGARAFGDGIRSVQNSQVLTKALQYVQALDATVVQIPYEATLGKSGLIHEGIISTRLGLPGKPAIAENLMLNRDIELLRYTGSRLHVTGISTKAGLELVQRAKEDGLNLTVSVTPYHLHFTDEDLQTYDTNLKVNPPLRTREDVEALREALKNGLIDTVASHHRPHEWDSKICEFEHAEYGMEGLETTVAAVQQALGADTAKLIELFAFAPAKIFNLPLPVISEKQAACITLFKMGESAEFTEKQLKSAARNNAFVGTKFQLLIAGVIRNHQFYNT